MLLSTYYLIILTILGTPEDTCLASETRVENNKYVSAKSLIFFLPFRSFQYEI